MNNDLRLSLTISEQEARFGTARVLTLPSGRQVAIALPASLSDGEEMHFLGQVAPIENNEPAGTLILTIHILGADAAAVSIIPTVLLPERQAWVPTPPASYLPEVPMITPHKQTAPEDPASSPTPLVPPSFTPRGSGIAPPPPGSLGNWSQDAPPILLPPRARSISLRAIILVSLAVLVIAGASGLLFVTHNTQINANVSATAVVNASATSQVSTQLTSQAEDATAIANATNTTVQATATVNTGNPDPYGLGGTLVVDDPLDGSQSYNWESNANCSFQGGAYHVQDSTAGTLNQCRYTQGSFKNFVVEIHMTILSGDTGGILFREDIDFGTGYALSIDTNGYCDLDRYDDSGGSNGPTSLVRPNNPSPAFHPGQNVVAMVAQGGQMTWYLNSRLVGSASDSTWSSGAITLQAGLYTNTSKSSADVAYNSIRIWDLGQ
ncbi:MAG: family 16 glycoside hydrolase [Ktedonobacteraceae bacterium]